MNFSIEQIDAIEGLSKLPDESVDLIITDPAYESLEKHRKVGTTTRLKHSKASSNDWFTIFPNARFVELFEQCYRVLKRDRHMYLFCDQETMFVAKPEGERAGFKFWKPIIWDKVKIGMGYHYRARYECILFFEKGKRRLNDLSIPDVLSFPRVYKGYPTEKPVDLAYILINQSTDLGNIEHVVDPFVGSGTFGLASLMYGHSFTGFDIYEKAVEVTTDRLIEKQAEIQKWKNL